MPTTESVRKKPRSKSLPKTVKLAPASEVPASTLSKVTFRTPWPISKGIAVAVSDLRQRGVKARGKTLSREALIETALRQFLALSPAKQAKAIEACDDPA